MRAWRILTRFGSFRENRDNDAKQQETNYTICEFWLLTRAFIFNTFFTTFNFREKLKKVKIYFQYPVLIH